MTNEEILATVEMKLHTLGASRGAALSEIQELRGIARRCKTLPALLAEFDAEAASLERAADGLAGLSPRYLEEYGGNRISLRREANRWREMITLLPRANRYRPARTDKIAFVVNCDRVVRDYFPLDIPMRPGASVSQALPVVRSESIDLAKCIWDSEKLDITGLDSWSDAVTNHGYDIFDSGKKGRTKGAKGTQK